MLTIGDWVNSDMIITTALLSGQITSGFIGNASVVSGSIASGQIGHPHFGSGAILSGDIASGQIGRFHLADGIVVSGKLGVGSVHSGILASGQVFTFSITSGGLGSGAIGSGQIGGIHLASGTITSAISSGFIQSGHIASGSVEGFFGPTRQIASGSLGVFDFGSGAVVAGSVGSGAIVSGNIASGQIGPNHLSSGTFGLTSGIVRSGNIGNAAVCSGNIASGSIGGFLIAAGGINSGDLTAGTVISGYVASGQLSTYHFASGSVITQTALVTPIVNLAGWNADGVDETLSGVCAVTFNSIGHLIVAMASVSGRTPAIGVVVNNTLGGNPVPAVYTQGLLQLPVLSGMMTYSGYVGRPVYLGRSGQLVTLSGGLNSGGFSSGDILQQIGVVANSGGVLVGVSPPYLSGPFLNSGSVLSGYIASGAVIGSLGGGALVIASGTIGPNDLGSGSIRSGVIASGQIGLRHLASGVAIGNLNSGSVLSGYLASGSVAWPTIGDGGVQSGNIASGNIGLYHLASGAVGSGTLGSGSIIGGNASGARNIASGTLGRFDLGNATVLSGHIGSGQIQSYHLGSGTTATRSQYTGPFFSGFSGAGWAVITEEIISGGRAVALSQSGNVRVAMAGVSGRMPAIGVMPENTLSGIQANVYTAGLFQLSSGLADYSGYLGQALYVGRSGQIVTLNGSFNSGNFLSGDVIQTIGVAWNSGGLIANQEAVATSGGLVAVISGQIASGSISRFTMASGAINSGHIASGAVIGSLGVGRSVASGSVGPNDLGSGSILSGHIASGQIGQFHLTLPAVFSGNLASGQGHQFLLSSGAIISGQVASGAVMGSLGGGAWNIASGTIGPNDLGFGIVVSGSIGSGSVNTGNFASGATVTRSQFTGPFFSGTNWTVTAEETISGVRAVQISQSGNARVAMASVSGRMPAAGIVVDNVLSGIQVNVYTAGSFQFTSGLADYSGYLGQSLFVGRSGQIVTGSGAFNSGGFGSGDVYQQMGVPFNSGGIVLETQDALVQGFVFSGDISSGQVFTYHLASGALVTHSLELTPFYSGSFRTILTEEIISGVRAVAISQSGNLRIAMAAVSGRMPAIGIVNDNVLSGIQANVHLVGAIQFSSGLVDYSGYVGKRVFVGRSGHAVIVSGSWASGGFLSGDVGQVLGTAVNSGSVLFNVYGVVWSGGPLGIPTGFGF